MERDWKKLRRRIMRAQRLEGMKVTLICAQAKISREVFHSSGTVAKLSVGIVCTSNSEVVRKYQNLMAR